MVVVGGWWLEVDVCLDVGERGQGSRAEDEIVTDKV